MLDILKSKQIHKNNGVRINRIADSVLNMRLASNPLISHHKVEPGLVANLQGDAEWAKEAMSRLWSDETLGGKTRLKVDYPD